MLEVLDWLFHLVHLTVILINLTFWMSLRTLRMAQVTLVLTVLSWFGGGLVYGFGYCFLTDWHWQLKEKLGDTNVPSSYVKLVVDRTFHTQASSEMVDTVTFMALGVAVTGCLTRSLLARRQKP